MRDVISLFLRVQFRYFQGMRLWDLLFLSLVALPWATGGLWGRIGGARLEYTVVGPALALLLLWLAIRAKRARKPFGEGSRIWSLIDGAFSHWRDRLRERGTAALWLPALAVAVAWWAAALSRHRGFSSHAADLGIFTNVLWNISRTGEAYSSLKGGISFFADHQMFLLYPLGALYRLAPTPAALLAWQSLALSVSAIAVFLLVSQRLSRAHPLAALSPFLVWAYAPIRAANLFDFHPEVMQLPLFLFGAWALQEKAPLRRALGVILFALALSAKESAGPVACGLGLAWALGAGPEATRTFTRRLGVLVALAGFGAFWFDTKLFPRLAGFTYVYADAFAPLGPSLADLAQAPFRYPGEFFGRLFDPTRFRFLLGTLGPLLALPLLGGIGFAAALPGYLMLFLTAGDQRLSLGYHYGIEPAVGLFFALPAGLALARVERYRRKIGIALVMATALFYGRSEAFHWRHYPLNEHQRWVRSEALPALRTDTSLSANGVLVPHVANRRWVQALPELAAAAAPNAAGETVECVAWEASLNEAPMNSENAALTRALLTRDYILEKQCASWQLFRRPNVPSCLRTPLGCAP